MRATMVEFCRTHCRKALYSGAPLNAKRWARSRFGHFAIIDILNSSIAIILVSVSQQWDLSNSQIASAP
ncbi:MAG: hypothetical protein R2851_06260 [Caldilineaceae bacterium]